MNFKVDKISFSAPAKEIDPNQIPVIFLHGFTQSSQDWNKVITSLDDNIFPIAIDLIGHGKSESPTEIDDYKVAGASSDFYYISGNDGSSNPMLIKVNPANDSATTLLTAGLYDIYKMTISSDNIVLFNALRMADGVKIIGQIDAIGTVTILDETLDKEMVVLERMN